jgi:hypothetical protein
MARQMNRICRKFHSGEGLRTVLGSILVFALLSYSWMFSAITVPNERSRVYLSVALVDDGAVSIDGPIERFGRTADLAKKDRHYFTDKAPGASLLGAGIYALVRAFSSSDDWTIVQLVNLFRTWLMIPLGLMGFLLMRRMLAQLDVSDTTIEIVSFGWILACSAFHYSTAFYGHQIVAVCFLTALYLIERSSSKHALFAYIGAGSIAGLAGLTEYQSGIPCVLLFCYVVSQNIKHPARVVAFAAGALSFVGVLLAYNNAAFGGPFELSYHHLASGEVQALHSKGIAGVSFPYMEAVIGGLFSLHRGLLATSPVFILFPAGIYLIWRRGRPGLALLLGLSLAYYLMFIFSAKVWYGGWSFGPRLLVPVMAWGIIPVAYVFESCRKSIVSNGVIRGLFLCGLFYHQTVHLVFQELPQKAVNPLVDVVFPAIGAGVLSPNMAAKLSEHPGIWTAFPVLVFTVVAALVLTFYGLSSIPKRRNRIVTAIISWAVVAVFFAATIFAGPGWDSKSAQRHIEWMQELETIEYQSSADR